MADAYGRALNFKSRYSRNAILDSVAPGGGMDKKLSCKAAASMRRATSSLHGMTWCECGEPIRCITITPFKVGRCSPMGGYKTSMSRTVLLGLGVLAVGCVMGGWSTEKKTGGYGLGRPPTIEEIRAWDIDISPNGEGLPPGQGTVKQGAQIYASQCAACHGVTGSEGPNDRLVGGTAIAKSGAHRRSDCGALYGMARLPGYCFRMTSSRKMLSSTQRVCPRCRCRIGTGSYPIRDLMCHSSWLSAHRFHLYRILGTSHHRDGMPYHFTAIAISLVSPFSMSLRIGQLIRYISTHH